MPKPARKQERCERANGDALPDGRAYANHHLRGDECGLGVGGVAYDVVLLYVEGPDPDLLGFAGRFPAITASSQLFGNRPKSFENRPESFGNRPESFGNGPKSFGNWPESFGNTPVSTGSGTQSLSLAVLTFDGLAGAGTG